MKTANKLIATASTTSLFLFSAVVAFADTTVKPCASKVGNSCNPNTNDFGVLVQRILDYVFIAGAIIAVLFLIWGGIKWITAGGDKTKVAAARETIIGAIIGLVVVFAGYFIIDVVLKTFFNFDIANGFTLPSLY